VHLRVQARVDLPSPAAIAKSLDKTSKLSIEGNPFEFLAKLKPADQSNETVVEACMILAKSVTVGSRAETGAESGL
jgi:hypothetical protein